jgi:hypothetical protein
MYHETQPTAFHNSATISGPENGDSMFLQNIRICLRLHSATEHHLYHRVNLRFLLCAGQQEIVCIKLVRLQ